MNPYPLDGTNAQIMATLINANNQHTLYGGHGIKISKTGNGTQISMAQACRKDNITWRGNYDFNAAYFPNDLVVIPNGQILDQSGSALALTAGNTYVCVSYVPASNCTNTQFFAVVSAMGGSVSDEMANSYRWYSDNTYYPTTYSGSQSTVSDSGYNIQSNIQFWQPIGSSDPWPPVELDPTKAHSTGDYVYISPANTLVTSGMIDLDSDIQTFTDPGIWRAVKAVPAMSESMYHVPQLPLPGANGTVPGGSPMKGDADGADVYWLMIWKNDYCDQ